MRTNAPPHNRCFHQILRDSHLTTKMKWRDLFMQIFGHEALVAEEDTANITHCFVFNIDFYRLNTIRWNHLARRKLLNPFKWIEFLTVAPLELFSWSIQRLSLTILKRVIGIDKTMRQNDNTSVKLLLISLQFLVLICLLLLLSSLLINLAVNLVTGVMRRFIAPARYLIRPAIEMAKNHPKSFATITMITLAIAIGLTITVLTGGLPAALSGLFLTGALVTKLVTVVFASTALNALLIKGANVIRDLINGVCTAKKSPPHRQQQYEVDSRNQQTNYNIKFIEIDEPITKEILDQTHAADIPLIIKQGNKISIYGRNPKGDTTFKELRAYLEMTNIYGSLFAKNEVKELSSTEIDPEIYDDINIVRGHTPKKIGITEKVTQIFHAIDVKNTEVKMPAAQNNYYTAALFTGTESLFYPKRTPRMASLAPEHPSFVQSLAS